MTTGMRRGLTHYGDAGFSLFLRKAFIKAMGYSDDALGRPIAQMMAMASADVLAVVGSRQSQPAAYGRGDHHHAGVRTGLSLLVASKYVGVGFGRAVVRSLPLYVVFFLTIAAARRTLPTCMAPTIASMPGGRHVSHPCEPCTTSTFRGRAVTGRIR